MVEIMREITSIVHTSPVTSTQVLARARRVEARGHKPWDEAPKNSILRSTAGKRYSNMEGEPLGILHGLEKFHHYCFAWEVSLVTDDKPLLVNFSKGVATLSHRLQCILLQILEYRISTIKNSPIQNQDNVQVWTRPIHSRLVVMKKLQREEGMQNSWYEHTHWCDTYSKASQNVYHCKIDRKHHYRMTPCNNWKKYHKRLANKQKWNSTRAESILDIHGWSSSDRWYNYQRQGCHNTRRIMETSTAATTW